MIILTIRTDKPEAEIGLYEDEKQIRYKVWQAHRALGITIHSQLRELLREAGMSLHSIQGIVVFQGPGSFTGLRIGLTVANTLASSLHIPIVARQEPRWLEAGISDILSGKNFEIALPEYGSAVHTTQPKK